MQPNALTIIHKFIRVELFDLSARLSTAAPSDASAVREAFEAIAQTLKGHAEREDDGITLLLRERAPAQADAVVRDHHRLDAQLDALCEAARSLPERGLEERAERLSRLYLDWNQFVSAYLAHLDDEERALFSLIADALPPVEFVAQGAAASAPDIASAYLQQLERRVTPDEFSRIEQAYRQLAG